MDPLTMLMAGGEGMNLLQGIISLFGKERDPVEERQRVIQMFQKMFGPEQIGAGTNQLYGQMLNSPFGQMGMNNAVSGAQRSQNLFNRNIAAAGGATSGIGQIGRALQPSVGANAITNFKGGLYNNSLNSILGLFQSMMGGSGGVPMRGSGVQNLMGFAQGVGNTDWGKLMQWWNSRRGRQGAYGTPSIPGGPNTGAPQL